MILTTDPFVYLALEHLFSLEGNQHINNKIVPYLFSYVFWVEISVVRSLVDKSGSHKRASNSYKAVTERYDKNPLDW